ncbi:MAG: glucose-6-phosphate dehydrogenase assembly protein OpcA, partial [Thermomicrobiaceae bacterium]
SVDPDITLDLQTIEQEIAQLWHPDVRGDDPITSLATRASVLNLVIYAPDDEIVSRVQEVSERLSRIHPCRVILFNQVPERSAQRLAPEIYATCEAGGSEPSTPCIERIRIPVTRRMYRQLPSLVQPLIIPELPAYLWWPGALSTADAAFVALARSSNYTIVDSLRFEAAREFQELAELEAQLPSRAAIGDLNWQRLQPWRELTAQFFDIRSVNWALTCIRDVEIDVGRLDDRALPTQALLLTSWLAHCLGWTPFEARRTRNDRWYIGFHDQYREHVRIIIRSRPDAEPYAGHILAMNMSARNSQGDQSTLSLSRSRGSSLIRMHAKSGLDTALHHAKHHPLLPDEALLTPILESTIRDHVFDASLAMAVETMELFARPEAT